MSQEDNQPGEQKKENSQTAQTLCLLAVGAAAAAIGYSVYDRNVLEPKKISEEFGARAAQALEDGCYEVISAGTFKKGAYGCSEEKHGATYTVTDKVDGEEKTVVLCVSRQSEVKISPAP